LVDEDPRLDPGPVSRVVAGRLERELVPAALPDGHRRAQRDADIWFVSAIRVDPDERELRVMYPALRIGQRLIDHCGERVLTPQGGGAHAVFDLARLLEDFRRT